MTLIKELNRSHQPQTDEGAAELVFSPVRPDLENATIKVVGVGGGGGNATQRMAPQAAEHVEVICVNTDAQALRSVKVGRPMQIGRETTRGLGAGAKPEVGREAAMESRDQIAELMENTDMLFITAGMGGGTGTGAAPVIAELAREHDVLTVAVVTRPFEFEGPQRSRLAEEGICALSEHVDSIITLPNDRLLPELGADMSVEEAFAEADKVLHGAVQGISDLILRPGSINVDFADVRTVMKAQGQAIMGTGIAKGENRAAEATQMAINCRLLDEVEIVNARAMLVNITTNHDLTLSEFHQVAEELKELQHADVQNVIGTAHDEKLDGEMKVTIVVAGFGLEDPQSLPPEAPQSANGKTRKIEEARPIRAVPEPEVEGNVVRAAQAPDWTEPEDREKFDIPAYLRKQHD